jgi:hypothetical protein
MKEIPFAEFIVNVFAVLRSVEQTREAILLPPLASLSRKFVQFPLALPKGNGCGLNVTHVT